MEKNILIIGFNSEIAQETIKELKLKNYKIYATSRHVGLMEENILEYNLDVTKEEDFILLKDKIANVNFDTIINFTGIAIAGAIEELNEIKFKKQLDVNLFGLLKIIKYLCPNLNKNGKLINVSSMASYGIFPFISPYCISKASADILLNLYSVESDIKIVSIRPGAVATKFWDNSVELNKDILNKTNDKFQQCKQFILDNAQKKSLHATNAIYVAKKIAKIIDKKNPKTIYNIGYDSKIASLAKYIPQKLLNNLIKLLLKLKLR